MIAFLDIGSTLIEGPSCGPGARIADELGLSSSCADEISLILFCTNAAGPEDLANRLAARFGVGVAKTIEAVSRIWNAQLAEAYVLEGAVQAIESLQLAGIRRAYVSNIWPPFFARFESSFPAEASEQSCYVSFRTGVIKPDTVLLTRICEDLGVHPREVVMVGDTWSADLAPAIELGMATIWILHRTEKEKPSLVKILNGVAQVPDLTLARIGELTPDRIWQAFENRRRRLHDRSV